MQKIIEAEHSDLFDVLALVAFAAEPGDTGRSRGGCACCSVKQGVDELDPEKLSPLLQLKYRALNDAFAELGKPDQVRRVFVGFQRRSFTEQRVDEVVDQADDLAAGAN